jgi:hypothetical protein
MVHADDVNLFDKNINAIKNNMESLLVACQKNGLEANMEETKFMSSY